MLVFVGPAYCGRKGVDRDFRSTCEMQGRGKSTRVRAIDLAASTYVTGGWPLTAKDTRLGLVNGVEQLSDYDPKGCPVDEVGVQVRLDTTVPKQPRLRLILAPGVEAPNGYSQQGRLWVRFYGAGV